MRKIVLDTETTGLYPKRGHKVIEIGAILLHQDGKSIEDSFHTYINPERDVPKEAYDVHGISAEFLQDKPKFHEIADQFLKFIDESYLIIHNAVFDINFLNHELFLISKPAIPNTCVIDTLRIARNLYPGERVNLDALCNKFKIDLTERTFHGALKDAKLLAEVYYSMTTGMQRLFLEKNDRIYHGKNIITPFKQATTPINTVTVLPSNEELENHNLMRDKLPDSLWNTLLSSKLS